MQLIKIIIIFILIGSIGIVTAYNSESGLANNESFHADYSLWMGEIGDPYALKFHTCTDTGTYVYRPDTQGLDLFALFSWTSWRITTHFLSGSDVGIWTSWELQGKTYNETSGAYEDVGASDTVNHLINFTGGMQQTETENRNVVRGYLLKPTTETDNFIGIDIDPVHPDYIEVKMTVGNGLKDIEYTQTVGITMTSEQAQDIGDGESGIDTDYGFGSGRGGAGGTSEIYNRIVYDDESGSKQSFIVIFYGIIPLIFIMYGFKLVGKIIGSYGNRRQ